jgi:hypothetical protein
MPISLLHRLCNCCTRRHKGTHPPTCDAFPERIPTDIRLMRADHRQPYDGDNGIRFELVEGMEEEYRLALNKLTPESQAG